jgi:ribosome-binding factor A
VLVKPNFSRERREKLYEREIALILHKICQEDDLSFFSLSHCVLRGRGESLQIYLNFSQNKKNNELLKLINKKYSPMIKKELAKSKKFPYIPNVTILIDKEPERINILEEIVRKIS